MARPSAVRTAPAVVAAAVAALAASCRSPAADDAGAARAEGDAAAVALAEAVLERMGGREAWERTGWIRWRFFGSRTHDWDRREGRARVATDDGVVVLLDLDTRDGRAWRDGEEVLATDERAALLEDAWAWWVNDSYWLVMPYKLLDPGVNLAHLGPGQLADGRPAQVLEVTFDDGVGLTPRNRYLVRVADDTGLVEEWSFFADAGDDEPRFTGPWAGWRRFGDVLLPTDHGRGFDWQVAAGEAAPPGTFDPPDAAPAAAGPGSR